jgi:multidrug efflux pump subunit AcrB
VIGFVGAIILVGVVVKNAIVLVDYVKLLRERGYDVIDAIVDGSSARLRPVLMTTLTTALAMSPLASTTSPTRTSRRAQIPTRRSPPWSTPMASAA